MANIQDSEETENGQGGTPNARGDARRRRRRRLLTAGIFVAVFLVLAGAGAAWLGAKASTIKTELEASLQLVPKIKESILNNQPGEASTAVGELRHHTAAAREAASDPLWSLATAIPWLGANFSATAEIARTADDVATLGAAPLVQVYDSLDWNKLLPTSRGSDLEPIRKAAPVVASAANAVRASAERLDGIDASSLLPQVAKPLAQAREQVSSIVGTLDTASSVAGLAPGMLGSDNPRHYLLLIQNNAEARATGGIPGALAVLTAEKGRISLSSQSSGHDLGEFNPAVPVDAQQESIYSNRLGTFMQDVNLTPDFPTAATTALKMWEQKKGEQLDGAISIDPVALGYILDATGPVSIQDPQLLALARGKLPTQLSGNNVVKTLLSDVYEQFNSAQLQDPYFAGVAKEIFGALSSGKGDAKGLLNSVGKGVQEHRILVWSADPSEQSVLSRYPLSGSISGPSVPAAQFGAYFNDGTGAKMDYYVERTVQLITQCSADGYGTVKVRITSRNTAPADAATKLPSYVTGGGIYGIPPGEVQSNVIAYGPAQSQVVTATQDGNKVPFGAQQHENRPVATLSVRLAPGQSSTVEFTFGKIVQHSQPEVVVTPTVESVDKVVLPSKSETCGAAG